MDVIFLVPGLISLFLVMRGRMETAFLSVYVPCLILLPQGYSFRIPHLAPISAAEFALIPVAFAGLAKLLRQKRFVPMDLLVTLFTISAAISEVLRERVMNDGFLLAMDFFMSVFLAYFAGRALIEPGLRVATAKRFVICMLLLGPVSLYDWRFSQSLYGVYGGRFFGAYEVQPTVQLRSGHGRVAASFNDAEIAGIAFALTIALNAWMVYLNKSRLRAVLGSKVEMLEKYRIADSLLLLYLFLSQSRGPMLALGAGWLILQIMRFKNTRLATCLVAAMLAIGAYGAFVYFSHYTDISDPSAIKDEQQGSALYRRQMNELYKPIVQAGGLLGWGKLGYPTIPSMFSIDNEFLRSHLAYGDLGYYILLMIVLESIRSLTVRSWKMRALEDRALVISMLGIMAILWISISTVYMGEQLPQIAFLLLGWSQSIVPGAMGTTTAVETAPQGRFAFNRVFQ